MAVSFDQKLFTQVSEIAKIVKMEGSTAYACHESIHECWASFCGLRVCFVGDDVVCLKSTDMEINLVCTPIANDNPINGDISSDDSKCQSGYKIALHFINGTPDNLLHWHKDITAFSPDASVSG